jgi:hypothetical protein
MELDMELCIVLVKHKKQNSNLIYKTSKMKTKFLILTVLTSILFTACQKEDESKNPYKPVSFELSDYEKSFLTLNLGDTLYYTFEHFSVKNTNNYPFCIVSDIDTVINDVQIKYTYSLDEGSLGNTQYKIVYQKTAQSFKMSVLKWSLSLMENNPEYTIEGLLFHYDTLRINGFLYNDVYHIEADTTYNNDHCIHNKRAFFAPNYGLVSITNDCYHKYFYNF